MKQSKVALIGLGRISLRHIEAINKDPNLKLACVCDTNIEKAREVGKAYNVPYLTNFRELSDKEIDIVSICTPSGSHPAHIRSVVLNTGIRKIVCEKPIALNTAGLSDVYTSIALSGSTLMPVFQNRYNPIIKYLKTLIDSGSLGKIYQFSCNIFWNRDDDYYNNSDWHGTKLDGGAIFTQGSHYVDMVQHLFGEVSESYNVCSRLRGYDVHDTASVLFKFENEILGTINTSVNAYMRNFATEFTIIAENGVIKLSGTNLNKIEHWDVKDIIKPNIDFEQDHIYGNGHDYLYSLVGQNRLEEFPSYSEIVSGIKIMEQCNLRRIG